jgi:sugar phosphate isomerase/epimerase
MRIGFTSFAFRWAVASGRMNTELFLIRSLELGAGTVQICENIEYLKLSSDERRQLYERFGERLNIEVGARGFRMEDFMPALSAAADFGSDYLRIVVENGNFAVDAKTAINTIETMVPYLEKAQIKLGLENHFNFTPHQIAEIMQRINHPLIGVCFDPFNSISHLVGVNEAFTTLQPYINSLHLKDATIRRKNTGFYISGCSLGEGVVPAKELLQKLSLYKQIESVHLESWMDALETENETFAAENLLNSEGIKYLRSLL